MAYGKKALSFRFAGNKRNRRKKQLLAKRVKAMEMNNRQRLRLSAKANWRWLLLVAAYSFLVGVAAANDWAWVTLEDSAPSVFDDGWFVGFARLAAVFTPFLLLAHTGFKKWLDSLTYRRTR